MTTEHPITPPTELIKQWLTEFYGPQSMPGMAPGEMVLHVAAVAARWGADQELDACCEHLKRSMSPRATVDYLRAHAALAEPEPEGPTQRQLLQLAAEFWPEGCEPTQATAYARAVLARWGNHPGSPENDD